MSRNNISLYTMMVVMIIVATVRLSRPQWNRNEILTWDVFGYYMYLPATFIYDDPKLEKEEWLKDLMKKYPTSPVLYQALQGPQGNKVIYYTSGMSMLYSPFFFTAHAYAKHSDYPPDGMSFPYQLAIAMGCLLYTIIGLIFARKILLRFFDDKLSAWLLVLIALGTNYFHNTAFEGIMPHNAVFMLYTLIVWFTIRWHEEQKIKYAFLLGVFMALAVVARGSELVSIFIPLLWGVKDAESFKEKMRFLWNKKIHVITLAIGMFIIGLPQLLYWKTASGHWIYNSYGDAGFMFRHPFLVDTMISFKKGWLIYTPLMALALAGLVMLYRYQRNIFYSVLVYFVINYFLVASWFVWWGGASFGQRYLMQSYAVMMLPLGYFFVWLRNRGAVTKRIFYGLAGFFIFLNLFQTWQYSEGIIDNERMTKKYYWRTFLATSVTDDDRKLLEIDRGLESAGVPAKGYDHHVYQTFDFEEAKDGIPADHLDTIAHSGAHAFRLDTAAMFSPGVEVKYRELTQKDHCWIRVTAYLYSNETSEANPASIIVTCMNYGKHSKYSGLDTEKLKLQPGQWNKVTFDYVTPYILTNDEVIKSYIWLRGKQSLWIDDMVVEVFEPKEDVTE